MTTTTAAQHSKADPIGATRMSISTIYTLSKTRSSNKRRLTGSAASSSASTTSSTTQPVFPLQNPIGAIDDQSDIGWYRDPNTGRVTDPSNDEDENFDQAKESLPPSTPVMRTQYAAPYYPIMYSCEHVLGSGAGENGTSTPMLHEMAVPITVEMLIPSPVQEIEKNIQALQWSFLNAVGDRLGLIEDCDIDSQGGSNRMLRRGRLSRHLQVSKLPYSTFVYKIASNPKTKSIAECRKSTGFESSIYACYSIRLYVDIGYKGRRSERNLVQEFIQSIIQNQIELDPSRLFAQDISGLHWLENSQNIFGAEPPVEPESHSINNPPGYGMVDSLQQGQRGDTGEAIGVAEIMIPAFTFVFLVLFWLGIHYWHRLKKRQQVASKTEKVCLSHCQIKDIETGSFRTEPLSLISPTYSSSDPVDLDDVPCTTSNPVDLSDNPYTTSNPVDLDDIPHPSSNPIDLANIQYRRPNPVDLDDILYDEVVSQPPQKSQQEGDYETGVPPRPPTFRASSLKLKKRRKKKKRKKVAALQRVNSRDNISVMPTVSESEDEGSEMGSECDSVGASDEDGSSYDASSGCLTPGRSPSRTSSHASSPQFSANFDDNSFSDIEFVLEAPDLANLLDREAVDERYLESADVNLVPSGNLQVHRAVHKGRQTTVVERRTFEIEQADVADPNNSMGSDDSNRYVKSMLPLPWLR